MPEDNKKIVTSLIEDLNRAVDSKDITQGLLCKLTDKIQEKLGYAEVSLWTINHNDTAKNNSQDRFLSASVVHRKQSDECKRKYEFKDAKEFSHPLKECLFANILKEKPYRIYTAQQALDEGFTSKGFIKKAEIIEIIVVPITDAESPDEAIMVLELSRTETQDGLDDKGWGELSQTIHEKFSFIIQNYTHVRQNDIIRALFELQNNQNDNEKVFFEDVKDILLEFCPCQGFSFYIKNLNDYALVATNDPQDGMIESHSSSGEKLLELIENHTKAFISDNLSSRANNNQQEATEKIFSIFKKKESAVQTGMFVPMISITSRKMIGFLIFVNKTNNERNTQVDYFNNIDKDIIEYAANYLSPVVESSVTKEEQSSLMNLISHEVLNPLQYIIDLEIPKLKTIMAQSDSVPCQKIEPLIDGIKSNVYDTIQVYDDNITNLYPNWKDNKGEYNKYNFLQRFVESNKKKSWCALSSILEEGKALVKHQAKQKEYNESNIRIDYSKTKDFLFYVDKKQFISVFRNLFENAIKYVDEKKDPDKWYTEVSVQRENKSIVIFVNNNGLPIKKSEKDSIFNFGFRGQASKNIDGHGIGLAYVKAVIESYNGNIELVTTRGSMVSFKITLPQEKNFYKEKTIKK